MRVLIVGSGHMTHNLRERSDDESVHHEEAVCVGADETKQPVDGEKPATEGRERPDEKRPMPPARKIAEQNVLHSFEQNRTEDDRDEKQEREASGAVAVELHEAAGRDRDPRA